MGKAAYEHAPVMLAEAIESLAPRSGGVYCDATVGLGGHAEAILEASAPDGFLVGLDRDPEAIAFAARRLARFGGRVRLLHARFSTLAETLRAWGIKGVDGLLFDLGVSSLQLDAPERGFSFGQEGPIDMRMDRAESGTALDLIRSLEERNLAERIARYGEERRARAVARRIKAGVAKDAIMTTVDLAREVRAAVGSPRSGAIDAATRTFQAIRIALNNEMGELETALGLLPEPLNPRGRVVVLAFHSIEDRLVKQRLAALSRACTCPPGMPICRCPAPAMRLLTPRALKPTAREVALNRRARSARMRAAERRGA